jgi:hypothetical protein
MIYCSDAMIRAEIERLQEDAELADVLYGIGNPDTVTLATVTS